MRRGGGAAVGRIGGHGGGLYQSPTGGANARIRHGVACARIRRHACRAVWDFARRGNMRVGSLRDQLVVLVFEIEGHRYAIDTDSVLEIVRAVQPTRLPRAPRVITGVINARGELLP